MKKESSGLLEFGKFRLDTEKKILWHKQNPVPLTLKSAELLCVLVLRAGQVVTKDEIWSSVWNDAFVEETNLTHNVYLLRKTLKGLGEKNLIQTVPRRGYRFTGEIREVEKNDLVFERRALTKTVIEIEENEAFRKSREDQNAPGTAFFRIPQFIYAISAGVLFLLLAGFILFNYQGGQSKTSLADIKSIAVLPFKMINANSENEHQGLGLADLLITRLSNVRELTVRPTSAVLGFEDQDSISLGEKLKVDVVLEGTIYRTNDKVRITARLLKVSDQTPIWAEEFEKPLLEELKLQDEVALQVINALAIDLSGNEKAALTKRFTESAEAYQLYLKGRYEWNKRNGEGMKNAQVLFRQAIDKDPNFALAYVGLADTLAMGDSIEEPWFNVSKALELDPNLAEAHATSGFIYLFHYWDWNRAEKELKTSIELKPNYATAHHWYAELLAIKGRNKEAKAEMQRALEINPSSYNFLADLGQIYYFNREYDIAKEYCNEALKIYPDFHFAHLYLQYIYLKTGEYDKAVEENIIALNASRFTGVENRDKEMDLELDTKRQIFRERGIKEWMKDRINEGSSNMKDSNSFYGVAMNYAFLGDKENALNNLEMALLQRRSFFTLPFVKADPIFDNLHDEPRYQEILRQMDLQN